MPLIVPPSAFASLYDTGITIEERWENFFQAAVKRGVLDRSVYAELRASAANDTVVQTHQLVMYKLGVSLNRPDYVRVHGLKGAIELNGKVAKVEGSMDPLTCRIPIFVFAASKDCNIKPHNLIPTVLTTSELVELHRTEASTCERDGHLVEAAAYLINVGLLDPSDSSWRRLLKNLSPTTPLLENLFTQLAENPDPTAALTFAAALDDNFSVGLLRRGVQALEAREAGHAPMEFIQFCSDKRNVYTFLMKHVSCEEHLPRIRFFRHMCHAVDVLLGTGFPPAQRATFLHNLALSYDSGSCTPMLHLVSPQFIQAHKLACYQQAIELIDKDLSDSARACQEKELGDTRGIARLVHRHVGELLMQQCDGIHVDELHPDSNKTLHLQITRQATKHFQVVLESPDPVEVVEARDNLAQCAELVARDEPDTDIAAAAAAEGVRHLRGNLALMPAGILSDSESRIVASLHERLACIKRRLALRKADGGVALEAIEHLRTALRLHDTTGNALSAVSQRLNLATCLLGGLASRGDCPVGPEHYAEGYALLQTLKNLPDATPDLHEAIAPMLKKVREYMSCEASKAALASAAQDASPASTAEEAVELEPVAELPLNDDTLACLLPFVPPDDRLAFSLVCIQFNCARKKTPDLDMRTVTRSTLRSESLRVWAAGLGCIVHYPCWAEVKGLAGAADLNGRVCRILGPPNAKGRYPIEIDTGWGSMYPKQVNNGRVNTAPDLTKDACKLVRPANLRVLSDAEMQRATKVGCHGGSRADFLIAHSVLDDVHLPSGVIVSRGLVLQPTWIPKRHSLALHMRAWVTGGQEAQAQALARTNVGGDNPFAACMCTASFFNALSDLSPLEPMRPSGDVTLYEASTYLSPLMKLVGQYIFFQQLPINVPQADILYLENTCITQLMAAPDRGVSDSPDWDAYVGPVLAFHPETDLMPQDVLDAWKFALRVDPGDFDSHADFIAMFTAENYQYFVQHGRLPWRHNEPDTDDEL